MASIIRFDQVKINIAQGKFVVVTAYTQSGGAQSVKITNPNGQVVFEASQPFVPEGTPGRGQFKQISQKTFTATPGGDYNVLLTQNSNVLVSEDAVINKGIVYLHRYVMVTNDVGRGFDTDFNDLVVAVDIYNTAG